MAFIPNFTITPTLATALSAIELLKENVKGLPITATVLHSLYESARLQSVHYSTQIEGNRLTQPEVEQVLKERATVVGRQRDESEIKGYYQALEWMEQNVGRELTETTVKTLHALVEGGGKKRVKPTPYRDGQNVIRNSADGAMVYLPPEAPDVPALMTDLVEWIKTAALPCPLIAALTHYQFATIHPYYDGNGRTARLLTTLVLHQGGYGLKGLFSLEEYYARDLPAYYRALNVHPHHNYYFGRATADTTAWAEYFIAGMADAFAKVKERATAAIGAKDQTRKLRSLPPKQRKILSRFARQDVLTAKEVEKIFKFGERSARLLCQTLVEQGFLTIASEANKTRAYKLAARYRKLLK
ncbi:cell division protein Fic [Planctomycetales bacterium]|nr:cell division protein Fic [Planctomycetales bacterium]